MPRKGHIQKRIPTPDPRFNNRTVTKFINNLTKHGKRSTAERHFYKALEIIKERLETDELKVFLKAIDNVKPQVEVRSRRVGGSTYQVPMDVRWERKQALAIRWLITFAGNRGEKTLAEKLAGELIEASNNRGNAVKKKEETHRMAEANRAFAHYRW